MRAGEPDAEHCCGLGQHKSSAGLSWRCRRLAAVCCVRGQAAYCALAVKDGPQWSAPVHSRNAAVKRAPEGSLFLQHVRNISNPAAHRRTSACPEPCMPVLGTLTETPGISRGSARSAGQQLCRADGVPNPQQAQGCKQAAPAALSCHPNASSASNGPCRRPCGARLHSQLCQRAQKVARSSRVTLNPREQPRASSMCRKPGWHLLAAPDEPLPPAL